MSRIAGTFPAHKIEVDISKMTNEEIRDYYCAILEGLKTLDCQLKVLRFEIESRGETI